MNYHPAVAEVVQVVEYLSRIASKEMTVSVADTEKYLVSIPAYNLDLKIKPGDPIKPGSVADFTLHEGKRQVRRIPKEIFGVPFIGVGVPIKDNTGKIVGLILTGTPVNDQEELREMAQVLAVAGEQISAATENIANSFQSLIVTTDQVVNHTVSMTSKIQKLDEVVKVIRGITERTNVLGINAAIEAARAGQQGKGFSVVAEEIRKMSENTHNSTIVIDDTLQTFRQELLDISGRIQELSGLFQEQASGTEEIAATTKEISSMAQTLLRLAGQLS